MYKCTQLSKYFLFIIALLTPPSMSLAFPYQVEGTLKIQSEYYNPDRPGTTDTQIWEMEGGKSPDGRIFLKFYPEGQSGSPVCEVKIPLGQNTGEIEWEGIGGPGKKNGVEGLLVVPGFPAPGDILPINQIEVDKIYEDKAIAGGQVFVRKYKASCRAVSLEEARANGWLKADVSSPLGFQMVTVVDDHDNLVVRQLWPSGGNWWVYEETPMRKSWVKGESMKK